MIKFLFTFFFCVIAQLSISVNASDSIIINPNEIVTDFQDLIDELKTRNSNDVSKYLKELFQTISPQLQSKSFATMDADKALQFYYSLTKFIFIAQAYQVQQDGMTDLNSIRNYIDFGNEFKKRFTHEPKFKFLLACVKAQFIAYLLESKYVYQSDIIYKKLILESEDEDVLEWQKGYADLLTFIEFSIIQTNISNQQYNNLSKYHNNIINRYENFPADHYLKKIALSSSLTMINYYVTSSGKKYDSIFMIPRTIKDNYDRIISLTQDSSYQQLPLRATSLMLSVISNSTPETRKFKSDVYQKLQSSIQKSMNCISDNTQCLIDTFTIYTILISEFTAIDVEPVIDKEVIRWQEENKQFIEKILTEVLSKTDLVRELAPLHAQTIYKLAMTSLDHQKDLSIPKMLLNKIKELRTTTKNAEFAGSELSLRIALLQKHLANSGDGAVITDLLKEQSVFDQEFKNEENYILESVRIRSQVVKLAVSQNNTVLLNYTLSSLSNFMTSKNTSIRTLIASAYAQYFSYAISNPILPFRDKFEQFEKFLIPENEEETIIQIDSKIRQMLGLAIINHWNQFDKPEQFLGSLLRGFTTYLTIEPIRAYLLAQEKEFRLVVKERCVQCSKEFKDKNIIRIRAIQNTD
ncbi:MAG: hypothetical protein QM538_01465 [Methylacidiphilales bacterium]|nr:hypothetical protein [Candidatus Methylacidiphilales bacterium]